MRRIECRTCGSVKRERLDFLADNPRYTKRFAFYVGRRCQQASIRDVAKELRLDWETVKTLEKQYMQAQLARAGRPGPLPRQPLVAHRHLRQAQRGVRGHD